MTVDPWRHLSEKTRKRLLDIAAGAAVVISVSLILNQNLFGFMSNFGWTVSYGNF